MYIYMCVCSSCARSEAGAKQWSVALRCIQSTVDRFEMHRREQSARCVRRSSLPLAAWRLLLMRRLSSSGVSVPFNWGAASQLPWRHTGIVCENMQALGANLRKLPRQAKICTPPGGQSPRERLRKFASPTPAERANLRKYAMETTRERIAKICAPPKSYYPRAWRAIAIVSGTLSVRGAQREAGHPAA